MNHQIDEIWKNIFNYTRITILYTLRWAYILRFFLLTFHIGILPIHMDIRCSAVYLNWIYDIFVMAILPQIVGQYSISCSRWRSFLYQFFPVRDAYFPENRKYPAEIRLEMIR